METEEGFDILFALPDVEIVLWFSISIAGNVEIVIRLEKKAFHESIIVQHQTFVLNDFPVFHHDIIHSVCHWRNKRETLDSIIEQFLVHID